MLSSLFLFSPRKFSRTEKEKRGELAGRLSSYKQATPTGVTGLRCFEFQTSREHDPSSPRFFGKLLKIFLDAPAVGGRQAGGIDVADFGFVLFFGEAIGSLHRE